MYDEDKRKKKGCCSQFSSSTLDDETNKEEDKEMAMLTRTFCQFINCKRYRNKNFKKMKEELGKR